MRELQDARDEGSRLTEPMSEVSESELVTIRDWLRYAASRFSAAGLVYGHGTAALWTKPPISFSTPCTCRSISSSPGSTPACCQQSDRRCAIHREAHRHAQAGPLPDERGLDRRPFVLRGRAGHRAALLYRRIAVRRCGLAGERSPGLDPRSVNAILDLCTGSGCLAILAALAFPDATVDASDISRGRTRRRRAQRARLRPGGAYLTAAFRPVRRPCRRALRSDHRQSALRQRRGDGRLPARICGRAQNRPRRGRRRARRSCVASWARRAFTCRPKER